jgi:hypothetical protein
VISYTWADTDPSPLPQLDEDDPPWFDEAAAADAEQDACNATPYMVARTEHFGMPSDLRAEGLRGPVRAPDPALSKLSARDVRAILARIADRRAGRNPDAADDLTIARRRRVLAESLQEHTPPTSAALRRRWAAA